MINKKTRWWEFYYVRYFVGTVTGIAILLFLYLKNQINHPAKFQMYLNKISELTWAHFILFGVLGLAYCYVSSAPIFVFHATRAAYLKIKNKLFLYLMIILLISFVVSTISIFIWDKFYIRLSLIVSIFFIQLLLIVYCFVHKESSMHDYYKKLLKIRVKEQSIIQEYKKSYRHLREHANAYFIIFFEIILAIIIYSFEECIFKLSSLLIWIFPSCLVWFLASILEYKLSADHDFENL